MNKKLSNYLTNRKSEIKKSDIPPNVHNYTKRLTQTISEELINDFKVKTLSNNFSTINKKQINNQFNTIQSNRQSPRKSIKKQSERKDSFNPKSKLFVNINNINNYKHNSEQIQKAKIPSTKNNTNTLTYNTGNSPLSPKSKKSILDCSITTIKGEQQLGNTKKELPVTLILTEKIKQLENDKYQLIKKYNSDKESFIKSAEMIQKLKRENEELKKSSIHYLHLSSKLAEEVIILRSQIK